MANGCHRRTPDHASLLLLRGNAWDSITLPCGPEGVRSRAERPLHVRTLLHLVRAQSPPHPNANANAPEGDRQNALRRRRLQTARKGAVCRAERHRFRTVGRLSSHWQAVTWGIVAAELVVELRHPARPVAPRKRPETLAQSAPQYDLNRSPRQRPLRLNTFLIAPTPKPEEKKTSRENASIGPRDAETKPRGRPTQELLAPPPPPPPPTITRQHTNTVLEGRLFAPRQPRALKQQVLRPAV